MPDKTLCRRCGRIGFVRMETVIKGGDSFRAFYCGVCNGTWSVTDDGEDRKGQSDPPDRSRSHR